MLPPSLTRTSQRDAAGQLVTPYEYEGETYLVRDSARNAMLVSELFADEELSPEEKASILPFMVFPDPEAYLRQIGTSDGFWRMVSAVLWDSMGVDMTGEREKEQPVFDWQGDAARIRSSLLMAYNLDWDECAGNMAYSELCALLCSLLEAQSETPFQQAVYYRTAKLPKSTKYNKEVVEQFRRAQSYYRLDKEPETDEQRMKSANDSMACEFAAMKRAAERAANDR